MTVILFLPPALLLFTFFVLLPLIDAGTYAGYRWSGYGAPEEWVGARNFEIMTNHSAFRSSLGNTLLIVATSIFIQVPLAMGLALLIAENHWSNTVFRLVFFLPFILAEIATGLMWSFFFDGDFGITAALSRAFGTDSVYPLSDPNWAMPVILFVVVWKYFGFHMMIFIAALQGISRELIDAAKLDGASPMQIAWRIKIPLLRPAITVSVFFAVIGSLQLFDLIAALTGGGPSHSTHSLVSYLYTFGLLRLKVGFGSAVGIVLFVICVTFALIYQNTLMKKA